VGVRSDGAHVTIRGKDRAGRAVGAAVVLDEHAIRHIEAGAGWVRFGDGSERAIPVAAGPGPLIVAGLLVVAAVLGLVWAQAARRGKRTQEAQPEDARASRSMRLLDAMIVIAVSAVVLSVCRGPLVLGWLWSWFFHWVIGASLSAPIVFFGRKRVHWNLLDLLAFLIPFGIWVALMNASAQGKTLANLAEPIYFSFAIPVAALVRVMVGAQSKERACSIDLVGLLSLVAAGFYWWMPALPE
jgi:hypothetical protein